ncbi:hypothetical protein HHK36_000613 [Tetracentron sinense]|uniref:Uncharacterized protein n=1 Tax=Tetracentron sinense TaxID=13715 RepID=A0A834ZW67_TETSI|nr:hypothetical protein HHK36_000613 [Tetracentron sinense]
MIVKLKSRILGIGSYASSKDLRVAMKESTDHIGLPGTNSYWISRCMKYLPLSVLSGVKN